MSANIIVYDVCPPHGRLERCGVSQYWDNVRIELNNSFCEGDIELINGCPLTINDWIEFSSAISSSSIVHLQYPLEVWGNSVVPGLLSPIILRIFSKCSKIICTFHEWKRMNVLRRFSIYILALLANGIIFVSAREMRSYLNSYIGRIASRLGQKCSVIPIGVNLNIHDFSSIDVIGQRSKILADRGDDAFVMATFGFIYSAKRPLVSIQTVAQLRRHGVNAWIDFYGEAPKGGEGLEREMLQLAEELGVADYVKLHGYQSDDESLQLKLMASDVLLQLYDDGLTARRGSYWYAYSLGMPVITSEPVNNFEFEDAGLPSPLGNRSVYLVPSDCSSAELFKCCLESMKPWVASTLRPVPVSWKEIASRHFDFYSELGL